MKRKLPQKEKTVNKRKQNNVSIKEKTVLIIYNKIRQSE